MICIRPRTSRKCTGALPLTDADRLPWLQQDRRRNRRLARTGRIRRAHLFGAQASYRDIIIGDRSGVTLVYLKGSHDLIRRAWLRRHEHFMPVALLDSQFATLQEPTPDEHPITVDVVARPTEIVAEIMHCLQVDRAVAAALKRPRKGQGPGTSKGER